MTAENPPQPPDSSPPPTSTPNPTTNYNPITHNAALAMVILCPIALLLPTRGGGAAKAMAQNAVLGAAAFWGANTLAADYTGKSITQRSGERWGALLGFSSSSSPSSSSGGAAAAEGGQTRTGDAARAGFLHGLPTDRAVRNRELMEAERRRRAEAEGREYKGRGDRQRGWWERMWMGREDEGWKERRLEERKALESGKGYSGLIMDQLSEVWNERGGKGKGKAEDDREQGGKGEKKE